LLDGGIDFQFFAVWVDPSQYSAKPFDAAIKMIARMDQEVANSQGRLVQVKTADEAMSNSAAGKISYMLGVEGGHAIENDLQKLYRLYDLGMRYLTITWNNSTDWAVSCDDSRRDRVGLSAFGIKVIKACDSLGVMIDVSHVGAKTIEDILAVSVNPIVATHSGANSLRSHRRNLTDAQIKAIADKGGVIGVIFYPSFLVASGQPCNIQSVIRHIDHVVKIGGIDHVALGSDFDGVSDWLPQGLEDVTKMPALTEALLQKGYSIPDVHKILGGNMLRVVKQVCR
jgi:membrane dipeptidase